MPIYLTNIASMRARRHLANNMARYDQSALRLMTGFRINSAKDDPAGLQISNRMTAEINGLSQANRNAADGQAIAQTYEGALDEVTKLLQKVRTLAVQASNGTYTNEEREALQNEANQYFDEITRIANDTKYGGKTILLGEDSELLDKGQMHLQIGANSGDSIVLDLKQSMRIQDIYDATDKAGDILDANGKLKMGTQDEASAVLGDIDKMISVVNGVRGDLGAYQVRLDSIMRHNENVRANVSDARSRIRDTDYAFESMELMRLGILQQSSMMMLMQGNQSPNLILRLLGGM